MTLYYDEFGPMEAPLLVFIHGGGVGGWMWEEQVKFFHEYHCLVPTLPEHGMQKGDMPFSIRECARQINDLLVEKANGQEIIVVGFSLGAQIVIEMLSLQPTIIHKAMINSALTRPMTFSKRVIGPLVKLTYPLIKYKTFAKMQARILLIPSHLFDRYYEESRAVTVEGLVRVLQENMAFTIPDAFSQVKSKILVTVGEKERGIMKKSAHELALCNVNCHKIVWKDIGHGISLKDPGLFNATLLEWLRHEDT